MGALRLPIVNDSDKYKGNRHSNCPYPMKNYSNKNAVKFVIDDITRNRENEKYTHQLLGYGALGANQFLSVEDMIATFSYVQQAYDIDSRRGRRMYHEVYWFFSEELQLLNWNVELMWQYAYEIAMEFWYKRGHQVIFAIHYDMQGKYHIHFAVNTINYLTGAKLGTYKKDFAEREIACNEVLQKYLQQVKSTAIKPLYFGVYKGEILK